MTDVVFTIFGFNTNNSHFTRLNFGSGTLDIARQRQLQTGNRVNAGVWGVAAGYTVMQQNRSNLDVLGGFRFFGVGCQSSQMNY